MKVIVRIGAIALIAIVHLVTAQPVSAQVTSAQVYGTIKDGQGAVIPGATLVLVSESRGTKSAPVVSSATGDFVFPNITPDTYTLEVSMSGFKSWRLGLLVNQSITGDLTHGLSLFGTGAYSHLSGDFKDSPIVDDRGSAGQWLVAVGLAYTF